MQVTSWHITRCVPCEASERIQQAIAPTCYDVVGGQKTEFADAARPLKRAEDNVIGICRCIPAEIGLSAQCNAHRLKTLTKDNNTRLAVGARVLKRHTKSFLTAFAKIGPVTVMQVSEDIRHKKPRDRGIDDAVGPGIDETSYFKAGPAAE